eukprot:1736549-Pyramimonas_sp.AAC.2
MAGLPPVLISLRAASCAIMLPPLPPAAGLAPAAAGEMPKKLASAVAPPVGVSDTRVTLSRTSFAQQQCVEDVFAAH